MLFGAGLAHATLRFYFDYEDQTAANSVISTNLAASLLFAGGGALLLWPILAASDLGGIGEYASSYVLMAALAIIVIELNSEVMLAYLRARDWAWQFVGLSLLKVVVQISASVYLVVYQGQGLEGVMSANLAANFGLWFVLLIIVLVNCGLTLKMDVARVVLKYSIPFALSGIAGVIFGNLDRFILLNQLGVESIAIYGLATKFALLVSLLLIEPFSRGFGPYRFAILKQDNAREQYANITLLLLFGAFFLALGVSTFTPEVIVLFTTSDYLAAVLVVPILVAAQVASGLNYCFQTGMLIAKNTKPLLTITLVVPLLALPAS